MKFTRIAYALLVAGSLAMPITTLAAANTTVTVKQLLANPTKYKGKTVTVKNLTVGWVDPKSINLWSGNDKSGSTKCLDIYLSGGAAEKVGDVEMVTGLFTQYTSKTGHKYWEIEPSSASSVKKTGTGTAPKC